MPISNAVINDMVSGDDFEVSRIYPFDSTSGASFSITEASLAVQTRIGAPTTPNGAGTETPVFLTINQTASSYGTITDPGTTSGEAVLNFLLPGSMTGILLATQMYFFGIRLTTSTGQTYTPETGAWTPARGI